MLRTDGRTDGRTDRRTDERTNGRTDGRSGPTTRPAFAKATQVKKNHRLRMDISPSHPGRGGGALKICILLVKSTPKILLLSKHEISLVPFIYIYSGEPEEYPLNPFIMRYKNWARGNGVYLRKCNGKFVRNICIFGLPDISKAVKDIGLYANKFFYDYEPLAYDCLEEWLHEQTWKQYVNDEPYDTKYYESLDQVRYQVRKGENNTVLTW